MKNRLFVLLIIATLTQFTSILPENGIFSRLAGAFKDAPKDNLKRCKQSIRDEADRAVRKKEIALLEDIYTLGGAYPNVFPDIIEEGGWWNKYDFEEEMSEFDKAVDRFKLDTALKADAASLSESLDNYCEGIGAKKAGVVSSRIYSEEELLRSFRRNRGALDRIARAKKILASRGCLNPTIYWCANSVGASAANISGCDLDEDDRFNNNMFLVTNSDGGNGYNNPDEGFEHLMHHEATHWEKKDMLRSEIITNILQANSMDAPQAYHSWLREQEKRADTYALTHISNCLHNPLKEEMLLYDTDFSIHHQSPKKEYLMYEALSKRMRAAKKQDKIASVENARKHADAERIMQEAMHPY